MTRYLCTLNLEFNREEQDPVPVVEAIQRKVS